MWFVGREGVNREWIMTDSRLGSRVVAVGNHSFRQTYGKTIWALANLGWFHTKAHCLELYCRGFSICEGMEIGLILPWIPYYNSVLN